MDPDLPKPCSVEWGEIGGALTAQSDLASELANKAPTSHSHRGVYEPADPSLQIRLADLQAEIVMLKRALHQHGLLP